MSTKEGALHEFLLDSFGVDELTRFIRYGPEGAVLTTELPIGSSSVSHFVLVVVDLLRRRGMIDAEFFERLKDARPTRASEILALEQQWLSEPGAISPITHRLVEKDSSTKRAVKKQEPARIFVSYSHRDRSFVDELRSHLSLLQRQGLIDVWHDSEITAGEEWSKVIDEQLETADIILLLVSASFLSSDFCWSVELMRAMERHASRQAVVIPVILRPCLWEEAPFAKLQALPRDGRPIKQSRNTDEAWFEVASGIKKAVQELQRGGR
jgi:hypothetical protein